MMLQFKSIKFSNTSKCTVYDLLQVSTVIICNIFRLMKLAAILQK